MKRAYETPRMEVEEFAGNQAVAACNTNGKFNYTFDCMKGPNTDTENCVNSTIATGCTKEVGYATGYSKAVDWSCDGSNGHSNNNVYNSSWSTLTTGKGWDAVTGITVSYSGEVKGLLYADTGRNTTTYWKTDAVNGYVYHTQDSGGDHHMVAPVYNVASISAS